MSYSSSSRLQFLKLGSNAGFAKCKFREKIDIALRSLMGDERFIAYAPISLPFYYTIIMCVVRPVADFVFKSGRPL